MSEVDKTFTGSIAEVYETYFVPLIFAPYARDLAPRVAAASPQRVLEIAAGTGVVTRALRALLPPSVEIVATDLNQAMLDVAAKTVTGGTVEWRQADAMALPFADASFDAVVCQFGAMFFPDKVKGNSEAHRVLRDGGHYLLAIWDDIARNRLSNLAHETMQGLFPDNPPMFMKRGPFSYHDPEWIERDLTAAGFHSVAIDTVELASRSASAADAAKGLCYGSPMRVELELEDYGPDALDRTFEQVARAARQFEGPNGFEAPMTAHVVTATK